MIQQENWLDVAPEFDELGRLNFIEAGIQGEYDLDHETLANMAQADMVHITTVRDDGRLVGYALSVIISRHLQYKAKIAQCLGVYLLPEYRKQLLGYKLLKADEIALKAKGVQVLYGGYAKKNLGLLFDRLGWKVAEFIYTKGLE